MEDIRTLQYTNILRVISSGPLYPVFRVFTAAYAYYAAGDGLRGDWAGEVNSVDVSTRI